MPKAGERIHRPPVRDATHTTHLIVSVGMPRELRAQSLIVLRRSPESSPVRKFSFKAGSSRQCLPRVLLWTDL
ncbi:uncharacterized protein ColSpa_05395 [Colletotrichum spaethianum]|uniref:Uncharacterized protein n=1 Tax=Colletotrichum spaethianum TaxID=700344 RepID=A0AA37P7R0_9PEZI|nr:uncharacterized protein ColSpa_05395 [Colletotrichum spaethianum]GKT45214.1 hypothetical protein ColSpa_05395 [Colletotrichum spaethianum]